MVAQQRKMNLVPLQALREWNLADGAKVRFDFFYDAPTEEAAQSLRRFLSDTTDYNVEAVSHGTWTTKGTMSLITLSEQELDRWVYDMIVMDLEYDCEFTGWDAMAT